MLGGLEETYNRLIVRRDLVGLDDDQALEHIGYLTDLSGDLRRMEGLEHAVSLSEELQRRDLTADRKAVSHYFLGNAYANLRALAEDQGKWEQFELEREIFHLRMALRDQAAKNLKPERVCQILTNLGNAMSTVGRPVEAIQYWDEALRTLPHFSMARGSRGYGLSYYAASVHDGGHKDLVLKFAHADLEKVLSPEDNRYLEGNAYQAFERVKADIEGYLTSDSGLHCY